MAKEICLYSAALLLLMSAEESSAEYCSKIVKEPECPKRWNLTASGMCFRNFMFLGNWLEARKFCQSQGGDLGVIETFLVAKNVHDRLDETANRKLWIGLNDRRVKGTWVWPDKPKEAVKYIKWASGQPPSKTKGKHCTYLETKSNTWATANCGDKHGFICEKKGRPGLCPRSYYVLSTGKEKCIRPVDKHKTWKEAQAFCKKSGETLLTIRDDTKKDAIAAMMKILSQSWVALNDLEHEGRFLWFTGRTRIGHKYKDFHQGEPNGGKRENCVVLKAGPVLTTWFDTACSDMHSALCMKPKSAGISGVSLTARFHRGKNTVYKGHRVTLICKAFGAEEIIWKPSKNIDLAGKSLTKVVKVKRPSGGCSKQVVSTMTFTAASQHNGVFVSCYGKKSGENCKALTHFHGTCDYSVTMTVMDWAKDSPNITLKYNGMPGPVKRGDLIEAECMMHPGSGRMNIGWVFNLPSGPRAVMAEDGMATQNETGAGSKKRVLRSFIKIEAKAALHGLTLSCFVHNVSKYSHDLSCMKGDTICAKSKKINVDGPHLRATYSVWEILSTIFPWVLLLILTCLAAFLFKTMPVKVADNDDESDDEPD